MSFAVRLISNATYLTLQAPARLNVTTPQRSAYDNGFRPTHAKAFPLSVLQPCICNPLHNSELSKRLTSQINGALQHALAVITTTGFSIARSQVSREDRYDGAARTGAFPSRFARRRILRTSEHCQAVERFSSEVYWFHV
jgi:hypothetical protein